MFLSGEVSQTSQVVTTNCEKSAEAIVPEKKNRHIRGRAEPYINKCRE